MRQRHHLPGETHKVFLPRHPRPSHPTDHEDAMGAVKFVAGIIVGYGLTILVQVLN